MEENMIMNVPSAPEMQGTPMTPDLSMDMQSEMGDMTQNEIQEAQGALMQILQVINMLIEQGLNPEQIKAFLEQYGISEEELEQAAQALGVDIDMVLSGQMQAPQEPMMMAEGGGADVGSITPISPFEMTEAFGGPLYQMLNPGAQQMVDRLGLRGQGLSGAAAMAFGPKKVKGGLTALDDLTRNFLAKEKTRLEGIIKSIKEGTDPILRKENLATYQKQLDNVNAEIAENARLRKQYDEMVKDPSKFFKTQD
jgi:DNA-binding transcriptional MerR regulator